MPAASAPNLIETLALYIRNTDPAIDRAHALAEAVEQCNVIRFTGHAFGEQTMVAPAARRRAANAAAAWRDMAAVSGHRFEVMEALSLTRRWASPQRRAWLVDFVLEEREFSQGRRDTLARQGKAMDDGSFPIETTGDLRNAIRAAGRAGAGKAAAVKRHIIKRARALNATSLLPEGWVSEASSSVMDRSLVLEELFLPGGGGGGETALGDAIDPDGDGIPDAQDPADVHLSPGAGTVGPASGRVRSLQRALRSVGHYRGQIDGQYGPVTTTAVQAFQSENGLRPHGHVDSATLESLDGAAEGTVYAAIAGRSRASA